ncbi:MAG: hypothetical protein S4CHLAM37_11800 [Chlamydiia bacterium]|nr:hypothetical protein [Chlamydiia bacterium]
MTKVTTQSSSQDAKLPPVLDQVSREKEGKGKGKGKETLNVQSQGTSNNDPTSWMAGNGNAWKLALGLLMQEFAKVAQIENKLNKELHKARAEITSAQADAAKDQASASIATGAAESASAGISAAGSAYQGIAGGSSAASKKMIHSDANKKLADLHKEYTTPKIATQIGGTRPKAMSKEEFESKSKQIHADRDAKISEHTDADKSRDGLVFAHRSLADMGKGFGTSYGQAASQQAQSTSQLDQQMAQDVQGAEKTTQDVAATATQLNTGQVAVAAVRG